MSQDYINPHQAQSALDSINNTQQQALINYRPPIWMNIVFTLLTGLATYATILSSGNSLWTFISLVSGIVLITLLAIYFYRSKLLGVNLKLSAGNNIANFMLGLTVAGFIIGGQSLFKAGNSWIVYLATAANMLICAWSLHFAPTGVIIREDNA